MTPFALSAQKSHEEMGDRYYKSRQFPLARIEYDRALMESGAAQDRLEAKSALALMRENRFRDSLKTMTRSSYEQSYLRMYAAMRAGFRSRMLLEQGQILDSPVAENRKELARLLGGTLYMEEDDTARTRQYYERLQREALTDQVRFAARDTLLALEKYESVPRKSPWVAGILSAFLPGSGQIYARAVSDGLTAFGFTAVLGGSAAYMNHLETKAGKPHTGSILTGLVALGFYLSGITGSAAAANRYNAYQERQFHNEIRDRFFNLDFVEKTSGIVFTAPL
jgi:hypothetical protein